MTTTLDRVVQRASGMRDLVRAQAAESERLRTMTTAIVDEMWASGLMTSFNPTDAGGAEPSFVDMIETWIEMAWQYGSFGWVGIANLPRRWPSTPHRCGSASSTINSRWKRLPGQMPYPVPWPNATPRS